MLIYVAIAVADGAHDFAQDRAASGHSSTVSALAVAFCAGLFWPIDIVARRML
jgi:hypothetical protein